MSLTRTHAPVTAITDLLSGLLPDKVLVSADRAELGGWSVTVEVITPPVPQTFTMGGPEKARMLIQVTSVAPDPTAARLLGDEVRDVLSGVNRRGKPLHPLVVPGFVFDPVTTGNDGHGDLSAGVASWAETFAVTWQHRPDGVTPPS